MFLYLYIFFLSSAALKKLGHAAINIFIFAIQHNHHVSIIMDIYSTNSTLGIKCYSSINTKNCVIMLDTV